MLSDLFIWLDNTWRASLVVMETGDERYTPEYHLCTIVGRDVYFLVAYGWPSDIGDRVEAQIRSFSP